ncbi:MAG: helix-turn-helix domain-containing protein [Alphaproteobacteria bacterium]|uniref:Helix-turn-helix domain-containing protein n=1 Tax=Candidatus Nitrobium versatile TaxID=2884831 RepID=A0A953M097_9BACT|nr:helix-turn-helix domain-containing protein [Candidatus Nitrobium versatile]
MAESLMTVEEVAHMLCVSKWTVYTWITKKKIPVLRISRRFVRFRREDIEAWLQSKKQDARASKAADKNKAKRGGDYYRNKKANLNSLCISDIVIRAKKEVLDA